MSSPDYPSILSLRYPSLQWKMTGNDYATLTILDANPKPTQAALDAYWPGVETEIGNIVEFQNKIRLLQTNYDLQVQLVAVMRAILTNDTSEVTTMLSIWDNS